VLEAVVRDFYGSCVRASVSGGDWQVFSVADSFVAKQGGRDGPLPVLNSTITAVQ